MSRRITSFGNFRTKRGPPEVTRVITSDKRGTGITLSGFRGSLRDDIRANVVTDGDIRNAYYTLAEHEVSRYLHSGVMSQVILLMKANGITAYPELGVAIQNGAFNLQGLRPYLDRLLHRHLSSQTSQKKVQFDETTMRVKLAHLLLRYTLFLLDAKLLSTGKLQELDMVEEYENEWYRDEGEEIEIPEDMEMEVPYYSAEEEEIFSDDDAGTIAEGGDSEFESQYSFGEGGVREEDISSVPNLEIFGP